jgi:hypothetical protein
MKQMNAVRKLELLNIEAGGTDIDHCSLRNEDF